VSASNYGYLLCDKGDKKMRKKIAMMMMTTTTTDDDDSDNDDGDDDNNNNNNQHTWNVKAKAIVITIGATGTISQSLRQYLSNILGKLEIKGLQKKQPCWAMHTNCGKR
jgi:hypothetical protein